MIKPDSEHPFSSARFQAMWRTNVNVLGGTRAAVTPPVAADDQGFRFCGERQRRLFSFADEAA